MALTTTGSLEDLASTVVLLLPGAAHAAGGTALAARRGSAPRRHGAVPGRAPYPDL